MANVLLETPGGSWALSAVRWKLVDQQVPEFYKAMKAAFDSKGEKATIDDLHGQWRIMVQSKYDQWLKLEKSVTPDLAKRKAKDLPGYKARVANEKKHRAALLAALGSGVKGVKKAIKQTQEAVHVAGNADAIISATNLAVAQNVTLDSAPMTKALTNLISDAGQLGNIGGSKQVQRIPLTKIGPGLQARLDAVDAVTQGIGDTSLTRIRASIIDGITNGLSASDIADQINSVIADPYRADMIAITETNTAYNAGALDTYTEAGLTDWYWLAYDDACQICLDAEAANPHPIDDTDVPSDSSHPNCRCTISPLPGE